VTTSNDNCTNGKLRRVAIIGANGQVGAELCLYLKTMGRVEPIGIARSVVGTALLRRMGIECRHGDFRTAAEGRQLFEGCSAVVDLALPMGASPVDTKRIISRRLTSIFDSLDDIKTFICGSTMSVYRLDPAAPFYRWYGVTKRHAELEAARLASRSSREVYSLRLGQVHGEMQSCSMTVLDQLYDGAAVRVPDILSFTVFVFSIAEAVSNIMDGKESPGTYTLTSNPEWSWEEVLRRYASVKGVGIEVQRQPVQFRGSVGETLDVLSGDVQAVGARLVNHYKDLVSAVLSVFSEDIEAKLRFRHLLSKVNAEVARSGEQFIVEPFQQRVVVPGRRLQSLSDSRQTMEPYAKKVREMISTLAPKYEKHARLRSDPSIGSPMETQFTSDFT